MTTAAHGPASHALVLRFCGPFEAARSPHPAGVAPIAPILASIVATALCVA